MSNPPDTLCLGHPRFADGDLAAIAAREGIPAALRQAFRQYGTAAPTRVSGDFAVAVTLDDGRTFLAIDRFALRTLCYRVVDGQLRFAPRADALGTTEYDPQALFDYLYFHVIPSPRTIFKDVFRLPPGHYALFENGQLTVAPYWQPRFEETRSPSFSELCEIGRAHV
jgi:asparagine synthase (glutamine-hydrolysing)